VTAEVSQHLAALTEAVARWDAREEPAPAEVRRAASAAVAAIDGLVAMLYALRERLVSEGRAYDDATAARADALLERSRAERAAREHEV
jgi:hypothetical protein